VTVVLEPPLTRSGACSRWEQVPLPTGPRYLRSGGMSRWHRPRSGVHMPPNELWPKGRTVFHVWCGQLVTGAYLSADLVDDGLPVCGTCEGRACGAGQDDWAGEGALLFSPRRLVPPKFCPASRREMFEQVSRSVGRCLVCGSLEPVRGMGGAYNPKFAITQHEPGPGLVPGCPFHAWTALTIHHGQAMCACRVPHDLTEETR
jgi:hypothetical protein